mgnify:CR=1 FL=1
MKAGIALALSALLVPVATDAADSHEPFPAGPNALLAKQVCSACHPAALVIDRRYDEAEAKKFYRLMVGDPESEQGRLIVRYLTTALGER